MQGFKDVLVLTREIGEETEYVLITLWDNMEAVKRFVGPQPERAVYYPEDDRYFPASERLPSVRHYEVLGAASLLLTKDLARNRPGCWRDWTAFLDTS